MTKTNFLKNNRIKNENNIYYSNLLYIIYCHEKSTIVNPALSKDLHNVEICKQISTELKILQCHSLEMYFGMSGAVTKPPKSILERVALSPNPRNLFWREWRSHQVLEIYF